MKLLIELDEEYVRAIDKIKFLVGGRTDRKLQLEIIKAIKNGKALEQEPTTKNDSSELEKNSTLEKIRDQLKSNLRGVEIALEVLVENDPLRPKMEGAKCTLEDCLELIDKAESEE